MKQPNIIVFMTDHQRGDTLFRESPAITPNIDAFRKKSVLFRNTFCPSPHCCPSRATFFTGLYPSGHGVWNNVGVSNTLSRGLFEGTKVFSEDLKEAGYNLYFSGKWHASAEQSPGDFGFEPLYHNYSQYHKYPHVSDMSEWDLYTKRLHTVDTESEPRDEARIRREGYEYYVQYGIDESPYKDAEVVDATVAKLDSIEADKPFFIFTGTVGPHDPYFVPQRFLDLYDPNDIELPENFHDVMLDKPALYRRTQQRYNQLTDEEQRESVRRFYAFCSYEDYLFGKIVDAVERNGMMENTLIFYVSDHGDYVGAHGLWAKGLPCFREAYHVCGLVGGGLIKQPNREEDAFISLADFAPTFLELANVQTDRTFAGRSIVPFLFNERPEKWREYAFTQSNGNEVYGIQRSVFNNKWKYVFNAFDFDELYDLENDPLEMHNLIHGYTDFEQHEYSDVVRMMCAQMWQFAYDNGDNCVNSYIMTAFAPFGPGIIFRD